MGLIWNGLGMIKTKQLGVQRRMATGLSVRETFILRLAICNHFKLVSMKTLTVALVLAFGLESLRAQTATQTKQSTAIPEPTAKRVVERGANHRIWQWEVYEQGPNGAVYPKIHKYTELATGMHYKDASGQWQESQELIESYAGGAVAKQGQYQVIFANNLCSYGAIDMQTPDGKRLRSNVLGLMYVDNATGDAVLIAEVQDSTGELVADNQVLYPNAFDGVKADVRYTYKREGFEQDIILREQPPAPEEFGMDSATTELQVFTEFVDAPTARVAQERDGDQSIAWGAVSLGKGKAFNIDGQDPVSVTKRYVTLQGRRFLLEKVPVQVIEKALSELPEQASNQKRLPYMASKEWVLPKMKTAAREARPMMKLAKATKPVQGFVMDYVTMNGAYTNYTFVGREGTYYISGTLNLYGTNTFEGGTIIKYASGASINLINSSLTPLLVFKTSAYVPAMFTSKDDNSLGENISGSTGNPTGYYANPALNLPAGASQTLSGLRICYANTAIFIVDRAVTINDAQIIKCGTTISGSGNSVSLNNALLAGTKTNFSLGTGSSIVGQNVTFSKSLSLAAVPGGATTNSVLVLTNCIFADVTNTVSTNYFLGGGWNGFYQSAPFGTTTCTNTSNPFRIAGAGSYYLTNTCSFLDVGTTNITLALLAKLKEKTVYPPVIYSNTTISGVQNYGVTAARDTNTPDLGYHYDALDYAFGGVNASSNFNFSAGTAICWFELPGSGGPGYGIGLPNGASVNFNGTLQSACIETRSEFVQEGQNGNWTTRGWLAGIAGKGSSSGQSSKMNAKFTLFSGDPGAVRDYTSKFEVNASHCRFVAGGMAGYSMKIYLTNCLVERCVMGAQSSSSNDAAFYMRNCTMTGRYIGISHGGPWPVSIQNCVFDKTILSMVDNNYPTMNYYDYNAFVNGADRFPQLGAHDVVVSNFNWQSSWLGEFYLPTNSPLINAGSTTADQFGLYHFTTQTDQTKEATSQVDIGYHYVAVDANGNPIDTDGDGIPDYIEDTNGNGAYDGSDSGNWLISLYNGLSQTLRLQIYTPLKE